uniref:Ig-like domain-containing protein n=1 Tax=Pundamilia nyererei TaxID=303518 RepID=A0A3B4GXE1_9CICH
MDIITLESKLLLKPDAGIYYCVARAGRDVDVLPLHLAVEESSVPHLGEQVGPPVTGTVGEPVSLPCRMSGSPEPYLSWILPNGNVVRRGTAVPGGLTIETNGSLYLPNPSLRDGGHYRCTAVNHYGRDALSVQLILNSQHIPALRTSFPRGPQSAAGRSTRIRAPLLRDMNEGSGDGEESHALCVCLCIFHKLRVFFARLLHGRLLTTLEVWTRPPRMQLASYREATIHQGGEVHLECQADGVPAPLLSWVLPDRSVMTSAGPSTSRISVDTNGTLHISVTLPSDRGVYRCVASNSAGAASTSVRVHVSSLPPVIQQPREEHLLLSPGRPVYAHCSARGAPPPTLRWRIPDGTLVRPSQFLHGNLFVLTNGTLHIRKVGPNDSGSYECTASNAVGTDKRTVKLKIEGGAEGERRQGEQSLSSKPASPVLYPRISVTEKPRQSAVRLPAPPHPVGPPSSTGTASAPTVITQTASLVSIINGETLHLPCPASQTPGFTRGSFTWTMPSGKVLSQGESGDSGRYLVQEDGALTVQQASVFDRGTYTCRSTSYDSSSVSVITVPVIVIAYPPRITTGPSPVTYTRPGVAVELPCLTIATPRATVTWETPDLMQLKVMAQPRIYGNRYLSPQGSLVIQKPTSMDTGFYKCTAKNVIGVDTKATYLHVI